MILLESQWWNPLSWDDAPLLAVITALWFIVMFRANGTYWIGRAIANGAERSRWSGLVESRHYVRARDWLDRWGALAVTVSFLTVGIQTMVNLAAGIGRMPLRRYLPAVAVGCILWAVLYGTVGFIGFVAVVRLWNVSPLWVMLLGAMLLASLAWYIRSTRRRRRVTTTRHDDSPEVDS